jgi:hypothetical protein
MTFEEMSELKRRHSAHLLAMPGVCGVGVEKDDKGQPVLTVHLDSDDASIKAAVPKTVEGQPVKIVKSGPFRKQ